jgi:hypothetical protein
LYTFVSGDNSDEFKVEGIPPRAAVEAAVALVAEGLVPEDGAIEASRYMGCDVKFREVKDVAPGKVVICVSFKVTDTLLRILQGDFITIFSEVSIVFLIKQAQPPQMRL